MVLAVQLPRLKRQMLKQLLLLIVQMLKIINRKEQTMNNFKVLMNGIVKENPTFVLLLGMCPTLGTTSSAINGMGMGLATMFVLICSNVVISLIKNLVPDMVRIPIFVVVIASFVTLLQMVMQAYVPGLYARSVCSSP